MMRGYRSSGLNQVWLGIVLIHVIAPLFLVIMMGTSAGILLLNSIPWLYNAYMNRRKKGAIFLSAVGWSLTLYFMTHIPITYSSAFVLNMLLFLYIYYMHYGSLSLLISENHIRRLKIKDIGYIFLFTILLIIIGGFVNACSMYTFHNYVSSSIAGVADHKIAGIIVLALAPAFVEELLFRGYIFQRLGRGISTILLSAMLFSLCHMNFNQMCYAFVIGLFLALIFQKSDNLLFSMGVHFLFNLYTVICVSYGEHRLINKILTMKIGGYSIWNAAIVDQNGKIMMGAFFIGGICCLIAVVLLLCLLHTLKAEYSEENVVETNWGKEREWKPNIVFLSGVIVCILVAFLHEISG